MLYQTIIDKAFEASKNSYSPYSNFKVGACLKTKDGKYFIGTNIGNASYGASMCAERNAIYSAYCNGYRKNDIELLAVVASSDKIISPCGICRQVMSELLPENCLIILANLQEYKTILMKELLPMAFTEENLSCLNQDL